MSRYVIERAEEQMDEVDRACIEYFGQMKALETGLREHGQFNIVRALECPATRDAIENGEDLTGSACSSRSEMLRDYA